MEGRRFGALLCALALVAAACAAVATDGSSNSSDVPMASGARVATTSRAVPAPPAAAPSTPSVTSAQTSQAPETPDVSQVLPYKGMDASLIDATWLGPHDGQDDETTAGQAKGATPIWWNARNGSGDRIFTAYVRNGEVVRVTRDNQGKNYWRIVGNTGQRDLPDLWATGELVPSRAEEEPPDPDGWDNADDYAEANHGYFLAHGAGNPYDDAFEYWLENMD